MVLVCALVLNLKRSALERDNADVAPTYEQAMGFPAFAFTNADKCVVLHSTDRGRSTFLGMTGFKFRGRVRREINHEHHCGRIDERIGKLCCG